MLMTFKIGLLLGLSIISSIGAQNIFVIKQGLKKEHAYLTAMTCFMSDFLLILAGVTGASALILKIPLVKIFLLLFGIIFLFHYGLAAIKRSMNIKGIESQLADIQTKTASISSFSKIILLGLSFSMLNPQAILDTFIIIGGNANHYTGHVKHLFVAGAITASFIWFLSLTAATFIFAKKIANQKFWQRLEWVSGVLMLIIAGKFIWTLCIDLYI